MVPCPMCSCLSSFDPRAALASVAVPDANGVESDCSSDLPHGLLVALCAHQIVTGDMGVASVQANPYRGRRLQASHKLRHLLKTAPSGKLRPRRVLDENTEASSLPRQPLDGPRYRISRQISNPPRA